MFDWIAGSVGEDVADDAALVADFLRRRLPRLLELGRESDTPWHWDGALANELEAAVRTHQRDPVLRAGQRSMPSPASGRAWVISGDGQSQLKTAGAGYAIQIAVTESGRPRLSVVVFPEFDDTFVTWAGLLLRNGGPLPTDSPLTGWIASVGTRLQSSPGAHAPLARVLEREGKAEVVVGHPAGSFCDLGRRMLLGGLNLVQMSDAPWAGPLFVWEPMLEAAGCEVTDTTGGPVRFEGTDRARGIVASRDPSAHALVVHRLLMRLPLDCLPLDRQTVSELRHLGVNTTGDLHRRTPAQLVSLGLTPKQAAAASEAVSALPWRQ